MSQDSKGDAGDFTPEFLQSDYPLHLIAANSAPLIPCRFDQPTHGMAKSIEPDACIYRSICCAASKILPIQKAYGDYLTTTLSESTSSICIRSENIANRAAVARNALRKHIHEISSTLSRRLPTLSEQEVNGFRTYIECIDIRSGLPRLVDASRPDQEPAAPFTVDEIQTHAINAVQAAHESKVGDTLAGDPTGHTLSKEDLYRSARKHILDRTGIQWYSEALARFIRGFFFSPLQCRVTKRKDPKLGKYIGFVDLRLHSPAWPVSLACLVAPRSIRHDPAAFTFEGVYSPKFGGHGFSSSFYCSIDLHGGGHACSQACVVMALGLLSDRGADAIGGFDASIAKKRNHSFDLPDELGVKRAFKLGGLLEMEVHCFLNDPVQRRTTASLYRRPVKPTQQATYHRVATRLVAAYTRARLPVILFGNAGVLYGDENPEGHSIVIVGYRKRSYPIKYSWQTDVVLDDTDFIYHDPNRGPFQIRPSFTCLRACQTARQDKDNRVSGDVNLVFVGSQHIRRHAPECLDWIFNHQPSNWKQFFVVPYLTDDHTLEQAKKEGVALDSDFTIDLVHKNDLLRMVDRHHSDLGPVEDRNYQVDRTQSSVAASTKARLKSKLRGLSHGWYWLIQGFSENQLEHTWVFAANEATTAPKFTFPELTTDGELN